MRLESAIHVLAGSLVLLGVVLGYFVNPYWRLLPVFVGLNLVQSAFTGFCPAEMIFKKLSFKEGHCCSGK